MNPKQNDSQAEVNDNDIVIEENTRNNKPDVPEGVTAEPNYETPLRKQGFFSTKKGKKVLFGIIGVVLLAVLITILVVLLKKDPVPKPCEGECCDDPNGCDPIDGPHCEGEECPVVNLNYKTNDVYVYEETLTKDSNIELNNQNNNGRRLDDSNLSKTSIITSKYLINIYNNKTENHVTTFYAYVFVIDMKKKTEKKEETMGGEDITKSKKVDDKAPVVKVSFNYNGILTFEINQNMDKNLVAYLYEFLEKIIPKLTKKSFDEKYVDEERNYSNETNEFIIHHTSEPALYNDNENKEKLSFNVVIKNNRVKKSEGHKEFSLSVNKEEPLNDFNPNNFTADIEKDQNVNRGTLIKKISDFTKINIELSSDENNEEKTKKINDLLKGLNFEEYTYGRRLDEIPRFLNDDSTYKELEIFTYGMPIHFNYPLFKSNLLGAKVGLIASITFTAMDGKFYMKMIFDVNGNNYTIFEEKKETNFHDIITKIRDITRYIYATLEDEGKVRIPNILEEGYKEIEKKLELINGKFVNNPKLNKQVFIDELQRIKQVVYEANAQSFSKTLEKTNQTTLHFLQLLADIKNGEEDNSKNIKVTSTTALNEFITSNKNNLQILEASWNNFYTRANDELIYRIQQHDKNKSMTFDTGIYYNIKDEMKKILNIYQNFTDNLRASIDIEKTKFQVEVDNKFEELVHPSLKDTEIIAENANNDISIIDSMRFIYGDEEGDNKRNNIVTQINNLRNIIETIMNEIISQIEVIYNGKIESTEFKNMVKEMKVVFDRIDSEQKTILSYLRKFNKFDIDFDNYFEDIIKLNDLEIEINERKKESFKKYIGDYLYKQTDIFISQKQITEIKQTITTYFTTLRNHIDSLRWVDAEIESKKFINIVTEINNKFINKDIVNTVVSYYTNKNFLNSMIDNYFKDLYNIYKVFNTTFYEQYYLKHAPDYVSKPTEIINKLLDISYSLDPENSLLHRTIQDLITTKIQMGITNTTNQIYLIIYEEYNKIIDTIYNSECCISGYNIANVKNIKENLKQFKSLFFDENDNFIETYIYKSSNKEDEFNLRTIIIEKTNEIILNLRRIVDQINIDFHHTFCYGKQIDCLFIESVGQIEHYYYQASKLRVTLRFIESLITIAQSMITKEKILIDLSATEYDRLFSLELNYKETEILTDIKTFIRKLNEDTKKFIDGSITTLKTDIIAYFNSGADIKIIKENIDSIAKTIFDNPKDILLDIEYYIMYACGPVSKIIQAFNEEINFHKYLSKNEFNFDYDSYHKDFQKAFEKLKTKYDDKIEHLFDDWSIPEYLLDDLKKTINDALSEYYENINENINSLTDTTKFEFLDMEYSVKEIAQNALMEAMENIKSKLDDTIKDEYNKYLESLKNDTKEFLKKQFVTIKNAIESEFQGSATFYQHYHDNWDEKLKVTFNYNITFQITTETQINDAIDVFFAKVLAVYNKDSLREYFTKSQEKGLKIYYFKFDFQDFSSYIKNDIYHISNITYQRLRYEKEEFQSNIKIFYQNAFTSIFSQFVNGKGREYLNYSVNFDYENHIYHDFTLMKIAINQTYYIIKTLLQEPTLKGLGFTLVKKFLETFPKVKKTIENIIPQKFENIIKPKIEIFKDNAKNKIVKSFIKLLEDENNKIRRNLNPKIAELIPKYLDSPFKGTLEGIFNEKIKSKIEEMSETYNTTILTNFEEVKNLLTEKGDIISKAIASAKIDNTDLVWSMMEILYNGLHSGYETYSKNNEFTVKSEKTNDIETFFETKIKPYLIEIRTEFTKSIEKGKENVSLVLNTFKVSDDIKEKTLIEVHSSNIKNELSSCESELEELFQQLRFNITNQFSSFYNFIKLATDSIDISGFAQNNQLRHLSDYQFNSIEKAFSIIEGQYQDFKKKVLNSKQYIDLIKNKSALISGLQLPSSTLTNDFYAYKILIEQYSDNKKIKTYFNELENFAEEIRQEIMTFIIDFSKVIDLNLNTIYVELRDSWNKTREEVNANIYQSLDTIFMNKFSNLVNTKFNETKVFQNFDKISFKVNSKRNNTLATINIDIKKINASYGYYINKIDTYDFNVHFYTGGDITLDIKTAIEDTNLVETISGKLGSGEVGVDANYTLHDLTLEYDGFVKINQANYSVYANLVDDDKFIYNESPYNEKKNISMKRIIRSLIFD